MNIYGLALSARKGDQVVGCCAATVVAESEFLAHRRGIEIALDVYSPYENWTDHKISVCIVTEDQFMMVLESREG